MTQASSLYTQQDDTTAVCGRNSISDITFYDPNNLVTKIEPSSINKFPYLFIEKSRHILLEERALLIKQLKQGEEIPLKQFHEDWIIGIILICICLYSFARTSSGNMLSGVSKFFLFKGIKDSSSREKEGLFHGQAKILNLTSFLILGLFIYYAASVYNVNPKGWRGIFFWIICSGIIFSAVSLRFILCLIIGSLSGEKAAFREYLNGVYLSYRLSAFFIFFLIILMSYTVLLPVKESFISGITVLGIVYLFRVFRLFIIFLNRNISIFYLILYLCALEFLPVLISVKYFTGLV
jgi:hypothetical protein